jgi:predicted RNA binding protein YcfA (HicA-like mRNA interferase family)
VSPALADLPLRKVEQARAKAGFSHVRTKGSHAVCRDDAAAFSWSRGVTVKRGTLASILRQAGLTVPEFL